MRRMLKLVLRPTVCAILLMLALASFAPGQSQDRVVEVYEEADAPETIALQIVEIKAGGNTVTLGQPFASDDDWLKSLSVRIKNVSDKTIDVLPVTFALSELNPGKRGDVVMTILRGLYGNGYEIREASDERKPILPGEEIDLTFTEKQLCIIREMSARKGITPTRIKFRPSAFVTFSGGARLRTGLLFPKS
jgi:hypothetical protein